MFISRKKKLLKDRDAGLVFQWRGGNTGNRGGMTTALVLSGLFFIVIFASFNVLVKSKQPPPRYTANITLLGNVGENMTWWVEKNSPYQRNWYENLEELGEESVGEKLSQLIDAQSTPQLSWRTSVQKDSEPKILSVYAKGEVELPSLSRLLIDREDGTEDASRSVLDSAQVELNVRSVDSTKGARLPKVNGYKARLMNSSDRLGETFSYMVTLSSAGDVINVTPLKWADDEVWKELENWLNALKFKPSNLDGEMILLEVDVRPLMKTLEVIKEVGP